MNPPYPNPHRSQAPLSPPPVQDIRGQLWGYRIVRSLQTNLTKGQLVHCPFYKPYSSLDAGFTAPPFLLAAEHYFEWRSRAGYPTLSLLIVINPGLTFQNPQVIFHNNWTYSCPQATIFWWDCPLNIPQVVIEWINDLDDTLINQGLLGLQFELIDFINSYYKEIPPYPFSELLRPSGPPALPHTPANPFTVPLVQQYVQA